jgi:hypothetical protein
VIATGFGPATTIRPSASHTQTPVDMSQYADVARLRSEPVVAASSARLSVSRRQLTDLPLVVSSGAAAPATSSHMSGDASADEVNPDFDLGASFDVPAFLRRQDG